MNRQHKTERLITLSMEAALNFTRMMKVKATLLVFCLTMGIGLVMSGFALYHFNVLVKDYRLNEDYTLLPDAQAKIDCSQLLKFVRCRAVIRHQHKLEDVSFYYVNLEQSAPPQQANPLVSAQDSNLVSVDAALAYLDNRTSYLLSVLLLGVFFIVASTVFLRNLNNKLKLIKQMNRSRPWTVITIPAAVTIMNGWCTVKFKTEINRKVKNIHINFKEKLPIGLAHLEKNIHQILAVADKEGKTYLPIDQNLEFLSLPQTDRNEIQRIIDTRGLKWY